MAENFFIQNFENFQGLDYRSSPITGSLLRASALTNLRRAGASSIRGRPGCQMIYGGTGFKGLKTHAYSDQVTGEVKEELIGINSRLWKMSALSVLVANATFDADVAINFNVATQTFRAVVSQAGVPYVFGLNPYIDLGTGQEDLPFTFLDFCQTIDAHASLTCSTGASRFARISTGGPATFTGTVLPVAVGHTVTANFYLTLYDWGSKQLVSVLVTAVAAATVTLLYSVTVKNTQIIGDLGGVAAGIVQGQYNPVALLGARIPFYYWVPINNFPDTGSSGAYRHITGILTTKATPVSWVNAGNVGYFAVTTTAPRKLMKYDGQNVYLAGLPAPTLVSPAANGVFAGGLSAGVYKYKLQYKQIDNRGNIVEGPFSNILTHTVAAPNSQVSITVSNSGLNADYNAKGATIVGPQVGVNTIVCDNGAAGMPKFDVGDKAFFRVTLVAPIPYVTTTRNITAVDYLAAGGFSITIDGAAVDVDNGQKISNDLRLVLWRTKVAGNVFFKNQEFAFNETSGTQVIIDQYSDLFLGAELAEPPLGKEHDPPTFCSCVALHQGLLITAGDAFMPNTVSFSSSDGYEYFPLASNSFDAPATIVSAITAIGSDTEDRLAIFKPNAYYEAVGALDEGAFTVRTITEGDYGVSGQGSLIKIRGALIGIGPLGPVTIQNGQLLKEIGQNIAPFFWGHDVTELDFTGIEAINDHGSRQYLSFSRDQSLSASTGAVTKESNGTLFNLDYENNYIWFDGLYQEGTQPNGGFALRSNRLYHLSLLDSGGNVNGHVGYVFRELSTVSEIAGAGVYVPGSSSLFRDNHISIYHEWTTDWEPLQEPSIDKEWLRIRLFSMPDIRFELVSSFSIALAAYYNFSLANLHSQITFAVTNDTIRTAKLTGKKARALQFQLTTDVLGESPYYTGMEIKASLSRLKEDMLR